MTRSRNAWTDRLLARGRRRVRNRGRRRRSLHATAPRDPATAGRPEARARAQAQCRTRPRLHTRYRRAAVVGAHARRLARSRGQLWCRRETAAFVVVEGSQRAVAAAKDPGESPSFEWRMFQHDEERTPRGARGAGASEPARQRFRRRPANSDHLPAAEVAVALKRSVPDQRLERLEDLAHSGVGHCLGWRGDVRKRPWIGDARRCQCGDHDDGQSQARHD